MAKFVMECPNCGNYVQASTGLFAKKTINCTCGYNIDVKADRGFALASSWLIAAAKNRGGKSFVEKLTNELIDASNGTGAACKKREDTHRMAEANKAFAHYRY